MRRLAALVLASALFGGWTQASAQQTAPLFSDNSLLQITIEGPLATISAHRDVETGRAGTLTMAGEQLPIALAPRGITRRDPEICEFPQLRVDFTRPPPPGSAFAGQRRLKLVTHCRRNEAHQQYVLLEYAAYRMLNLLTPLSLRARLARIDYRDSGGRAVPTRLGFFLEDIDDAARRNGLTRMHAGDRISASSLAPPESALAAMFEYMIGNLDWSMRAGPQGEGCCHNFRLLVAPGSSTAVPVPYDFDFAGLVDTPYATPPQGIDVPSVRVRKYRGYCTHNGQALEAARQIRAKQGELIEVFAELPGITAETKRKATAYLQPFFAQVADDQTVQTRILRSCVR